VKTRRTIRPYWASPGENVHLPVNFYSTLGKSYDRKFFAQEVLGQYLSVFCGQVYHAYDPKEDFAF
jgi:hypothetical protein